MKNTRKNHLALLGCVCTMVVSGFGWADPAPAPVPQTGQTTSYGPRDDGELQKGFPLPGPRFHDLENGAVFDKLTSLVWLKNANCFGLHDWSDGLNFANILADGACDLSDGSVENDWRMPSINELKSLIDISQYAPALAPEHPFSNVNPVSIDFWSSTTYASNRYRPWTLKAFSGTYYHFGKKLDLGYTWPVRSARVQDFARVIDFAQVPKTGQTISYGIRDDGELQAGVTWPEPRFTDNGDGSVTDHLTNLVWLQNANCFNPQTWGTALELVNSLESGQCDLSDGSVAEDWRLPNRNEMASIMNYGQHRPAFPEGHLFTNIPTLHHVEKTAYWTSTAYARSARSSWYITSMTAHTNKTICDNPRLVWPVRSLESSESETP